MAQSTGEAATTCSSSTTGSWQLGADMHWAHAVSPDMIHWRHLPLALAPSSRWTRCDGCFPPEARSTINGTRYPNLYRRENSAPQDATLRDACTLSRSPMFATSSDRQLPHLAEMESSLSCNLRRSAANRVSATHFSGKTANLYLGVRRRFPQRGVAFSSIVLAICVSGISPPVAAGK